MGVLNRSYDKIVSGMYSGRDVNIEVGAAEQLVTNNPWSLYPKSEIVPIEGREKDRLISIRSISAEERNRVKRRLRKKGVKLERCVEVAA